MTDQSSKQQPLKPGEGTGGCLGLLVGLSALAALSFVLTAIGYFVAHALGWV